MFKILCQNYKIWLLISPWFCIFNVFLILYNLNESSNAGEHLHHIRSKRSLLNALQATDLKWSEGQEEAELFKKLLKHPKVSEMCADFQQPIPGEEGHLENNFNQFHLVQVHMFISPGQTVPAKEILALRLPSLSCKFSRQLSNHSKVRNFQETIHMFQNLQQGHNAFKVFPPNHKKRVCTQNDLTPFGTLQLIRNGEFLGNVYTKSLSSSIRNVSLGSMVNIQSIPEQLHYQSSLAFSHGFLEREEFARSTVEKSLPNFAPYSMNANLNCPKLDRYSFLVEDAINSGRYMYKRAHPSTQELAKLFRSQPVAKSSALELLGTLLLYFCNKLSPACFDAKPGAKCLDVTTEGLNTAFKMADSYIQSISLDPMFKDISILSTFPALKQAMEKMTNIDKSAFFHIYSGKYSFLLYLLRTLDVRVDNVPPAASRLVLEVYSHKSENATFFRLLFNGKDVTANVLSCSTFGNQFSGLCPLSVLEDYMNHGILTKFNSKTYEQACR